MTVIQIGEWNRVGRVIDSLMPIAAEVKQSSLRRWGLKAEGLAKGHMSAQDLGWTPLASKTVLAKIRKGQSHLILIATSSYFQSITSWVEGDTAAVGVRRSVRSKDGQVLSEIARYHEFGTRNIPPRPLWRPVLIQVMKWHYKENTPEQLALQRLNQI